jgi:hypothetical protein
LLGKYGAGRQRDIEKQSKEWPSFFIPSIVLLVHFFQTCLDIEIQHTLHLTIFESLRVHV